MRIRIVIFSIFTFLGSAFARAQMEIPFAKYRIIPNSASGSITVEATVQLQNRIPYIKDYGQIQDIRWSINGKEVPVKSERLEEIIMFSQAPPSGEARIVYTIKLAALPLRIPPRDIHLVGGSDFVLIGEGFFLGMNGEENGLVDVQWELPPGWKLALGHSGIQLFSETQKKYWLAGRLKHVSEETIGKAVVQIAIIDRPGELEIPNIVSSITSIFQYAWNHIGALKDVDFGIAIFPKRSFSLPGWTWRRSTIVDGSVGVLPHEILHYWMNNNTPAWFREGVLEYMTRKITFNNEALLMIWLRACLVAHNTVITKSGGLKSLAESSAEADLERNLGKVGDIYALMPILAYRLDKEIQKYNKNSNLDEIFEEVCRGGNKKVDILSLIKEKTGYDPKPLFAKYFYSKVLKPEELLDER